MDELGGFSCNCSPDFTGNTCDTAINNCEGVVCQNGGECVDGTNDYNCNCTDNFSGRNCEDCIINNCVVCSIAQPNVCNECKEFFIVNDFTGECGMF